MTPNRKPELTKEESEGFDRFCIEHYRNAIRIAMEASGVGPYSRLIFERMPTAEELRVIRTVQRATQTFDKPLNEIAFRVILERLTSPRIFLIDSWRKLSSEEHMVYSYPDPVEREKARAKAEEISKQAREMIQE